MMPFAALLRLPGRPARAFLLTGSAVIAVAAAPATAQAINPNESPAWQFESANDLAAEAALRDLIERKRSGAYAMPNYTTNIAHQYVCSLSASATGNSSAQTALANSPTTTGATASATGNGSDAALTGSARGGSIGTVQSNGGSVGSSISGSTSTRVTGSASQALNNGQTNSGSQNAAISDAAACAFGALN